MKLPNQLENLFIAMAAIAITVAIMQFTSIASLQKEISRQESRIEKQNEVIVELAKIEKYKIENQFDKIKAKDGEIVLELNNKLLALTEPVHADTIKPVKKSFWRKIF